MMIYLTDPRAKLPVLDGPLEGMFIHCPNDCFDCLGDNTSGLIKYVQVVADNGGLAWRCSAPDTSNNSPEA